MGGFGRGVGGYTIEMKAIIIFILKLSRAQKFYSAMPQPHLKGCTYNKRYNAHTLYIRINDIYSDFQFLQFCCDCRWCNLNNIYQM